ncbi:hypothetical protein [Arthrobacter sp. B2I5]|uniref:hypothetical protein n=1 Tax=Arthrobacter sp. B2I5 TaxID=3042266 RepID=UPI0027D770F8|nr:hypothetical protein [Arthrobacter sp. B2I5]
MDSILDLGFLCAPAPESVLPLLADVNDVIAQITLPSAPHQRFHAVEVAQGIAFFVSPISPSFAIRVAQATAQALQPLGFAGTITACAGRLGPRPRKKPRFAYNASICAVDAAIDQSRMPLAFREVKDNQSCWATESSAFSTLVDRLTGWAAENTKGLILAGLHFTMIRCGPEQAAAVLKQCCGDVGWANLLVPTKHGDWYVNFSREGWLHVGVEYKDGAPEGLNALTTLLQELEPLYDYAAVTLNHFGAVTPNSVMVRSPVPGPSDSEFAADHSFVKTSAPGIFAFQVLGPGHPEMKPGDAWQTFPLDGGKRMIISRDPSAWWGRREGYPESGFDALRAANKLLLGKWAGPVTMPDAGPP